MKNPSLENKKDQRDLQVRHSELRTVAQTLFLNTEMGRSNNVVYEVSCACISVHIFIVVFPCFFRM